MRNITVKNTAKILLGRQGENLATRIFFPLADLAICSGSAELVHQRATDAEPHHVEIKQDGETAIWDVALLDTSIPGIGRAELRWLGNDGEIVKSHVFETIVTKGLGKPNEPPDVASCYMLELMVECGLIEPLMDGAELYTDENGVIYIL